MAAVLVVHPGGDPADDPAVAHPVHRTVLIPHLGNVRLVELTARQLTAFFAAVAQQTNRFGQPHTPTTLAHIRTTLRAALNGAIREGLIRDNPARVELPRVGGSTRWCGLPDGPDWQATGIRPTVAVWTTAQLAVFLDSMREDRLYALWWLVALRGLRRGEVAGLRWADLDLDHRQLVIVRARTTAGYQGVRRTTQVRGQQLHRRPRRHTVAILREHRRRQRQEHNTAASKWAGHRVRAHQPPRRTAASWFPHPPHRGPHLPPLGYHRPAA